MLDVKTLTIDEIVVIRDALKKAIIEQSQAPKSDTRDMIMNLDFEIFERAVNHTKPHTN